MNFLTKLLSHSSKEQQKAISKGYCPNCWGDQEYENVIREKYKDPQIDVNNHKANYAFIKDFMVTHMNGIQLKSTAAGVGCPRCKMIIKE